MTASPTTSTDWQPRPCAAPDCGRVLQAEVAYCPFCGKAQAETPARPKPAAAEVKNADRDNASSTATPAAAPPPVQPAQPPAAQPPSLPPALPVEPESESEPPPTPLRTEPTAAPAPTAPGVPKLTRKWPRVTTILLAIVVLALWLRPKPEPAWVARCDALSSAVNDALASGDLNRAETNLAQAQTLCQDERRDALSPLAAQITRAHELAKTCGTAITRAETSLERHRPAQAQSQLAQQKDTCTGYAPYDTLNERAASQVRQAASLIDDGSRQLQAGELAAADQSLAQALALDAQANGADRLRTALANAQRQQAADAAPPANIPTVIPTATAPVASTATNATDALVAELLRDGRDALARKNYAEAKSSARNALRLSPGNRAANDLLQRAENAERQALQDIVID